VIGTAVQGEVIRYDGANWVDAQLSYNDLTNKPSIPADIGDLSNVTITSPATNQFLAYDGAGWINTTTLNTGTEDAVINGVDIGTGPGTGVENTRVGDGALSSLTTGFQNVSVGAYSLQDLTTGEHNVAVGYNALNEETIGDYNVAIGHSALQYASSASANIAIGKNAMVGSASAPVTESYNTAVGYSALSAATSARGNSIFGYQAGNAITTGDYNIVLGNQADASTPTVNNEITLGQNTAKSFRIPGSSFYINGGTEGTTGTRVGVNISSPAAQLHVNGHTQVDGTITANTFSFANWTVTESGGSLYFATGGTNKMKLDALGNLQVAGNVESKADLS